MHSGLQAAIAAAALGPLALTVAVPAAAQQTGSGRITPDDVAVLARAAQPRLPIRFGDGLFVIVAVRAEGTELINEVTIGERLSNIEALRADLQSDTQGHVCRTLGPLVSMGLTVRYRFTDLAGNRIESRVASC